VPAELVSSAPGRRWSHSDSAPPRPERTRSTSSASSTAPSRSTSSTRGRLRGAARWDHALQSRHRNHVDRRPVPRRHTGRSSSCWLRSCVLLRL